VLPLWVLLGVLGASEKKQKVKQKIPLFCFTILALGFLSAFFVVQDSGDKALFTGSEYIGSGKTAEAMAILTEYTQKNPEDPRGWYMLGEALHAGGKSSMALSAYEEAFTRGKWIYPEVTGGLLRKALVLHDTKLLTENEGVIDRVLKGFAEAVKNNDHYAAESDVPEILEWIFNEAIKAFPERKMEYTNLKEEVEKDAEMWRK
jgi:tetratricopeptide (TPR) repeat protein